MSGISPGHAVGAGCFLLLAGFRAQDGSWWWALVFALASACQVYLGLRGGGGGSGARPASEPDARSSRTWRALAVSSCVLTAGMLVVQPVLSPIAAMAALYCSWMVGRARGRFRANPRDRLSG
ncbi:hypothetical protein [Saccharopolyspora griseoalba]|uniref:Uncharacterized protein n=1 Tax=Saccharopolyspora griseoalba TaxID=1431848 RepID=A0ABW2LPJ7_9PSEU